MIIYDRLWKTMENNGISQYQLIKDYHISPGQLDRLRKNSNIHTNTINMLCSILSCEVEDIMEYIDK